MVLCHYYNQRIELFTYCIVLSMLYLVFIFDRLVSIGMRFSYRYLIHCIVDDDYKNSSNTVEGIMFIWWLLSASFHCLLCLLFLFDINTIGVERNKDPHPSQQLYFEYIFVIKYIAEFRQVLSIGRTLQDYIISLLLLLIWIVINISLSTNRY